MIAGATGSAQGRELAWKFVQDHFKELSVRYEGLVILPRLIGVLLSYLLLYVLHVLHLNSVTIQITSVYIVLKRKFDECSTQAVLSDFASEERAHEVEEFFKSHEAAAAERTIRQSLEAIRLNAKQLSRDAPALVDFLLKRK